MTGRGTGIERSMERKLKRVVDVVGASAGVLVASPLLVCTAVAIRVTMGSPVFFRQARPGLHGVPFTIWKFRTMRPPSGEGTWFRTDEVRLTRLGRFLRRTSIDELPELLNVLRGEMSLVGPRPLLMEYLPKYTAEENRRHSMPPGITGWAQVNGRQTALFSERLAYDVWYVDNWSLWLDFRILARTLALVFAGSGVLSGQDVDEVDDVGLSADRERVVAAG